MRTKFKDSHTEPLVKNSENLLQDTEIEEVFIKKIDLDKTVPN